MNDDNIDIVTRVRMALNLGHSSTREIAKAIGETTTQGIRRTLDALQRLHAQGQLVNLGGDNPIWIWRLGPEAPGSLRFDYVSKLLRLRPMEIKDIVSSTGLTEKEADNTIIEIRRKLGDLVVDLNPFGRERMYYILPEGMKDAALERTRRRPK